jgi:hypothetical protein
MVPVISVLSNERLALPVYQRVTDHCCSSQTIMSEQILLSSDHCFYRAENPAFVLYIELLTLPRQPSRVVRIMKRMKSEDFCQETGRAF